MIAVAVINLEAKAKRQIVLEGGFGTCRCGIVLGRVAERRQHRQLVGAVGFHLEGEDGLRTVGRFHGADERAALLVAGGGACGVLPGMPSSRDIISSADPVDEMDSLQRIDVAILAIDGQAIDNDLAQSIGAGVEIDLAGRDLAIGVIARATLDAIGLAVVIEAIEDRPDAHIVQQDAEFVGVPGAGEGDPGRCAGRREGHSLRGPAGGRVGVQRIYGIAAHTHDHAVAGRTGPRRIVEGQAIGLADLRRDVLPDSGIGGGSGIGVTGAVALTIGIQFHQIAAILGAQAPCTITLDLERNSVGAEPARNLGIHLPAARHVACGLARAVTHQFETAIDDQLGAKCIGSHRMECRTIILEADDVGNVGGLGDFVAVAVGGGHGDLDRAGGEEGPFVVAQGIVVPERGILRDGNNAVLADMQCEGDLAAVIDAQHKPVRAGLERDGVQALRGLEAGIVSFDDLQGVFQAAAEGGPVGTIGDLGLDHRRRAGGELGRGRIDARFAGQGVEQGSDTSGSRVVGIGVDASGFIDDDEVADAHIGQEGAAIVAGRAAFLEAQHIGASRGLHVDGNGLHDAGGGRIGADLHAIPVDIELGAGGRETVRGANLEGQSIGIAFFKAGDFLEDGNIAGAGFHIHDGAAGGAGGAEIGIADLLQFGMGSAAGGGRFDLPGAGGAGGIATAGTPLIAV